jgi:hypothetical protein
MSKVYESNLVKIHDANLNSSEKFKKTQAFPFFGPSPGWERFPRGRRGRGERQLGEGKREGKSLGNVPFSEPVLQSTYFL